ncbi:MAG: TolC family protein [Desulfobacteraceae bacterium]|nr:TolC family protein [Desulfobacteraceae bacterium]
MKKVFALLSVLVGLSPVAAAWASDGAPPLEAMQALRLETALAVAVADNPSVEAAAARMAQARERVVQARSRYWPRLDAGASAIRRSLSETDRTGALAMSRLFDPSAEVADPQEIYGANLTLSWTVFDGFQRKFSVAAAENARLESDEAHREVIRLLLSAVAGAYHRAQLARANAAIAKADEEFNTRQVRDARIRHEAGSGSLSAILNFEVQVNAARFRWIAARQEYDTAIAALAALMGLEEAAFPENATLAPLVPETEVEMRTPETGSEIPFAMSHRPDVLLREKIVRRVEAEVSAAKGAFYPVVELAGTVEGEREGDSGLESDDFGNAVILRLNYNLFSGGADRARLREAGARLREAEKNLEDRRLSVASEVRDAISGLKAAQEGLRLERENAELVRRNRDLVEKEYQAGQESLVRLNEAQRDLTQARSRLALARVSLQQAWYALDTATGNSLEIIDSSLP